MLPIEVHGTDGVMGGRTTIGQLMGGRQAATAPAFRLAWPSSSVTRGCIATGAVDVHVETWSEDWSSRELHEFITLFQTCRARAGTTLSAHFGRLPPLGLPVLSPREVSLCRAALHDVLSRCPDEETARAVTTLLAALASEGGRGLPDASTDRADRACGTSKSGAVKASRAQS